MTKVARRVRVAGRVQGVGFRAWTQAHASNLGLAGWVRNEPDGSVAALICGDAQQVERMLAALHDGPRGSVVAKVTQEVAEPVTTQGLEIRQ